MVKLNCNDMKKILLILFATMGLMACETRAPYITTDTPLHFEATDVMGTQMTINAWAEDDRAYFYFDLIEKDTLDAINMSDEHLMTLILDKLYQNYLNWRFDYLVKDEEYIASFESRTFFHGKSHRFCFNLKPETEYVMFGFCVNPDNVQKPIGKLYRQPVSTTPVNYDVSPMVIDFMVEVDTLGLGYSAILANVRPSVNGHATQEPYVAALIEQGVLDYYYHGSIREYADSMVNRILRDETGEEVSHMLKRDIDGFGEMAHTNATYWLVGAAYRISYPQAIYTRRFKATPGLRLPYGHDEKIDYSND